MTKFNVNLSNEEVENKIKELQEWIKTQPKMPRNLDKSLLLRYLKLYSFRVPKAQAMLLINVELRQNNPWFFNGRDPCDPDMQKILETFDMVLLQQHTPENYKVCIARLMHNDASEVNLNNLFKMYLMTCDMRFHLPIEDHRKMESGEIVIFDSKNFTLKHLTCAVISTLRLISKYLQTAHPVRLVQLHIVNCSPAVNKALIFIRPFFYAKLYNCFHFHKAGHIETLHEFVPKEILPEEYGGQGTPMRELRPYWQNIFLSYRSFLMNDDYWKPQKSELLAIKDGEKNKKKIKA